jgi:lysine 2,3-aminomutase
VRDNPEIRDVLITGGDPLTLRNGFIEHLLSELRGIRHVEIIRIGTRTIVTMPQRIDWNLIEMLKQFQPIYINTQFNHPQEITREAITACNRLANAGIPLGNQMVLLKGVNDDKYVVRLLNHELLKARVRPYYIFHAKQVIGTRHFKTSIDDGIEIMEHLRGHTSGMAIPTYIVNAPKGGGKTPILPQYIIKREDGEVRFRTWEGKEFSYPNN